eukprot:gene57837-biopygen104873
MPEMQRIIEAYSAADKRDDVKFLNPGYRLWLTAMPSPSFPREVLQNGVKMVLEPPKGLRSNLLRSYMGNPISDMKFYNGCNKQREWKKLLFECNYGGRVTDDRDRRCLKMVLDTFFCENIWMDDEYRFSPSGIYFAPTGDGADWQATIDFIRELPAAQPPEIFGLHPNADITIQRKCFKRSPGITPMSVQDYMIRLVKYKSKELPRHPQPSKRAPVKGTALVGGWDGVARLSSPEELRLNMPGRAPPVVVRCPPSPPHAGIAGCALCSLRNA